MNNGESDPSAYTQHREALEMYAFLLLWFVQSAEKLARSNNKDGETRAAPKAAKVGHNRNPCVRELTYSRLGWQRGQGGQEQDFGRQLDMVRPHTDNTSGDAQSVEVEDGKDLDDDAGEGNFCQVCSVSC